jgi:hypothetical protein
MPRPTNVSRAIPLGNGLVQFFGELINHEFEPGGRETTIEFHSGTNGLRPLGYASISILGVAPRTEFYDFYNPRISINKGEEVILTFSHHIERDGSGQFSIGFVVLCTLQG